MDERWIGGGGGGGGVCRHQTLRLSGQKEKLGDRAGRECVSPRAVVELGSVKRDSGARLPGPRPCPAPTVGYVPSSVGLLVWGGHVHAVGGQTVGSGQGDSVVRVCWV